MRSKRDPRKKAHGATLGHRTKAERSAWLILSAPKSEDPSARSIIGGLHPQAQAFYTAVEELPVAKDYQPGDWTVAYLAAQTLHMYILERGSSRVMFDAFRAAARAICADELVDQVFIPSEIVDETLGR